MVSHSSSGQEDFRNIYSAFEHVDPIYNKPIYGGADNVCGSAFSDTMSLGKKGKILTSRFGCTILPKDCHVEKKCVSASWPVAGHRISHFSARLLRFASTLRFAE